MARRRELRRFGPGPYLLGLSRLQEGHHFPFSVPAVARVNSIRTDRAVTLFAGENGAGKSTVLEAMAASMGFAPEGGEMDRLGDLPAVPKDVLDDREVPLLRPEVSRSRPRNGYFLRAESFFNVAAFIDSGARFAPDLSIYGDVPLHGQSHGESFLALAANRFGAEGLYLLDEPEAALSVTGALALLGIVAQAAAEGAQFIIATHSPILLAIPGAQIYEFDEDGVGIVDYDDVEAVRQTRAFLHAPERYLRDVAPEAEDDA